MSDEPVHLDPDALDRLRYPIGRFKPTVRPTRADIESAVADIERLPADLRGAVALLHDARLDTPYRPGGWSVRQLVHHVADSHVNAYVRTKLALTEASPIIRPYDEARWAELPDSRAPVSLSLELLDALHRRWSLLLGGLTDAQWALPWVHPESGDFTLAQLAQMYSWHGRHHLAHVRGLAERSGW